MASSCGLVSDAGWLADFLTFVTRRPTSWLREHPNGETDQAAEDGVRAPNGVARELEVRGAGQQGAQDGDAFHPGQVRAEAQVHAVAERQVVGGVALDPEVVGPLVLPRVSVGRAEEEQHAP